MDTGATVSLLPHKSNAKCAGPRLIGANSSPIRSWGFQRQTVQFGPHAFVFDFVLADVARPILGFDFLRRHHLDVSPAAGTLRFAGRQEVIAAITPPPPASTLQVSPDIMRHVPADIRELLAEFPGIVRPPDAPPAPSHGVEHVIETSGRPIFSKARRLDSEKLKIAQAEFQQLEKAGIVRRSTSPWASPLQGGP